MSGPALHNSSSPFLLLWRSNQKLSFYLVIFASSASFVWDLGSPTLLLSCLAQFSLNSTLSTSSPGRGFLPEALLPVVFVCSQATLLLPSGFGPRAWSLQEALCAHPSQDSAAPSGVCCFALSTAVDWSCAQGYRALSSFCLNVDNKQVQQLPFTRSASLHPFTCPGLCAYLFTQFCCKSVHGFLGLQSWLSYMP